MTKDDMLGLLVLTGFYALIFGYMILAKAWGWI